MKIFCIGLSKTGTKSLSEALKILGYRTAHWVTDETTFRELRTGVWQISIMQTLDAIADIPVPVYYPQFDTAFPGSKFILTTREKESWLKSTQEHCKRVPFPALDSADAFYRAVMNGCLIYNRERHSYVYDRHLASVTDYFQMRPDDLLVMDVSAGDAWEELCPFLGKMIPSVAFPWKNRRK